MRIASVRFFKLLMLRISFFVFHRSVVVFPTDSDWVDAFSGKLILFDYLVGGGIWAIFSSWHFIVSNNDVGTRLSNCEFNTTSDISYRYASFSVSIFTSYIYTRGASRKKNNEQKTVCGFQLNLIQYGLIAKPYNVCYSLSNDEQKTSSSFFYQIQTAESK